MARSLRILTYLAYTLHTTAATWGIVQLHGHIGSAFGSAAPFYFVWILTPVVVAHFGLQKWGDHVPSGWAMLTGGSVVALLTILLIRSQFVTDSIGPLAMLMYIPFPITEVLLVALSLVFARRLHVSGKKEGS